jgi:hypothetical protein
MTFAGLRALGLITVPLLVAGCNSRQPTATSVQRVAQQVDPNEELAQSVRDELRKATDPGATRRVIEQVNGAMARGPSERPLPGLSADEQALLQKDLGLRPNELAEVERAEFTAADGHFLDEALLLRDVVRSLDVDQRAPVARAEAALAWVVRNLRGLPPSGPAVPVAFAAMRGAGTPVERTYFLLALLSQMGLDAALVGDPSASPEGVWAVGVLSDGQIYLLDARLSLPLPGPGGKGVLTLAEARHSADAFKPLAIDPKLPYDVDVSRLQRSEILVTAPLAALSPRMRFLQRIVGEDTVRLTADVIGQRDRFRVVAGGATVRLWNSPAADAFPRLMFAFLPAGEGGGDTSNPGRIGVFYRELIRFEMLPQFLRELQGEPGARVINLFRALATGLDLPGQAHDLILRGQFREATDQLVAVQSQVKHRPSNPEELVQNARDWATAARQFAADASRQQRGALEPEAIDRMEQNKRIAEQLWKSPRGPITLLQYIVSDRLAAETTYYLGLCKHEEAERATQGDASRAAWATAQQWWRSFLAGYGSHSWAPAARRNLARALETSGQRQAARTEYEVIAESAPTPLERLACRYLAEKTK